MFGYFREPLYTSLISHPNHILDLYDLLLFFLNAESISGELQEWIFYTIFNIGWRKERDRWRAQLSADSYLFFSPIVVFFFFFPNHTSFVCLSSFYECFHDGVALTFKLPVFSVVSGASKQASSLNSRR